MTEIELLRKEVDELKRAEAERKAQERDVLDQERLRMKIEIGLMEIDHRWHSAAAQSSFYNR